MQKSAPKGASLFANSKCLNLGEAHLGNALRRAGNASEGAVGKVQRAACNKRPSVSDSHRHAFVCRGVGHSQAGAEREKTMGSGEAMSIEAASISSTLAMETIA